MASTFAVSVLCGAPRSTGLRRPGGLDGVEGIGLARPTPLLAVRPIDLDDVDAVGLQVTGEPGAVAASALDADQGDGSEAAQPAEQAPVAGGVRGKRLDAQQPADGVQGGGHMDVEVGVNASGDPVWHGGHGSSLLVLG